jgi:hypothetical protein
MRYLPTIDLNNQSTHAALLNGQLKLQCGQWVKCGAGHSSRFVKLTYRGGSIYAVHPNGPIGKGKVSTARFQEAVKCW